MKSPVPRRTAGTIHGILEGLVDYTHNHFIVEVLFQQPDYGNQRTTASRKSHGFAAALEDGEEVS